MKTRQGHYRGWRVRYYQETTMDMDGAQVTLFSARMQKGARVCLLGFETEIELDRAIVAIVNESSEPQTSS